MANIGGLWNGISWVGIISCGGIIAALMLPDLRLHDRVRMRKPHPCGGYEWKIVRLGADIGLECLSCGRRVMLTRRKLAKRVKAILPRQDEAGES